MSSSILTYNLNIWEIFIHNSCLSFWSLFYLTKRMKYDKTVENYMKNEKHIRIYNGHKSGNLVVSWFLVPR